MFSCAEEREEHCKQISLAYVRSAHSVWTTLCWPQVMAPMISWSTLPRHKVALKAAAVRSLQSCSTLCEPTDGSPPGSFPPGILQARILEWIAISFSNACMHPTSLQSCPTLCDPIDGCPPGSSLPGILQARTLEWVAISFSNACIHAKSLQSCTTLCDPMDSSPPGSSVHRIL